MLIKIVNLSIPRIPHCFPVCCLNPHWQMIFPSKIITDCREVQNCWSNPKKNISQPSANHQPTISQPSANQVWNRPMPPFAALFGSLLCCWVLEAVAPWCVEVEADRALGRLLVFSWLENPWTKWQVNHL